MFIMKWLLVLVVCLTINILEVDNTECEANGIRKLEPEKLAGTWYLYCDSQQFFFDHDVVGYVVNMELQGDKYVGNVTVENKDGSGPNSVNSTFGILGTSLDVKHGSGLEPLNGEYQILDVEYDSYRIMRGNPMITDTKGPIIMFFMRKDCPTEDELNAVNEKCSDFKDTCKPIKECPKK